MVACALALAIMVLLINVSLHDFWNVYEGVNAERETQNFFKNMGIFAGLLLLASIGMQQQESAKPARKLTCSGKGIQPCLHGR